ncbi:OmcA/MtrC family decaheme c-type cytochrome [Shewanella sp. MMG014]|uniref:OmcA/MtrC family decaheme c-type cytochrome n=1 Tax=Shewanella sp. MMG014 TaxID=2822691 RepID=UPI001B37641B|nr:OmcA/MtrC family decaheme c-type cytochrome [Shewanella sp. MMG014]
MMSKLLIRKYKKWITPLVLVPMVALTACSGDDGKNGDDGESGDINIAISSAKSLQAEIEKVTIDESLQVSFEFYLSNANGVAVSGLADVASISTLGAGIAKLGVQQRRVRPLNEADSATVVTTAETDLSPQWTSYINNVVEPGDVADNDLEEGWDKHKGTQWQASIESDCKEACIEAIGNGLYRYTFSQPLDSYSNIDGINTEYNVENIHRVYLELMPFSDADISTMLVNTTFDFDPTTGVNAPAEDTRVLLTAEQSCYRCHTNDLSADNSLLMHGNKRFDYEGCVMCHTSYSGDPETGVSIGMASLVHRIHKSDYLVIGYKGSVHDYSDLTYPGDMHQCQQCHIEDGAPQADFYQYPGQETCLSCHEKYAPDTWNGTAVGLFHDRDAFPDAWAMSCSGCHPDSNNPLGSAIFHNATVSVTDSLIEQYQFALTDSVVDEAQDTLTATLTFNQLSTNPDADPAIDNLWLVASGNPQQAVMPENNGQRKVWDLVSSSEDITLIRESSVVTVTINNAGVADLGLNTTGTLYAKVMVCGDKLTGLAASCEALETEASIVLAEVPADAAIPLTTNVELYTELVNNQKCIACHDEQFQQRVNEAHSKISTPANGATCGACHSPQVATTLADGSCQSCHTNDMVKYMNATRKHTPGDASIKAFRTINNSLGYRELVHSLHALTRTTKGYTGSEREAMTYPASANDCRACHDEGQLQMDTLAAQDSVIVAARDATSSGQVSEYSPTVAVCASCHNTEASWAAHAESFGGVFQQDASSGAIYHPGDESCQTCHGEGKSLGIDVMHGLN